MLLVVHVSGNRLFFQKRHCFVTLPPVSIKPYLIKEIENQTKKLALALKVKGFMNIQFAIKKDEIYVIEVNPRASRTVPFVSKAKGLPLAKNASRVMAGEK